MTYNKFLSPGSQFSDAFPKTIAQHMQETNQREARERKEHAARYDIGYKDGENSRLADVLIFLDEKIDADPAHAEFLQTLYDEIEQRF